MAVTRGINAYLVAQAREFIIDEDFLRPPRDRACRGPTRSPVGADVTPPVALCPWP